MFLNVQDGNLDPSQNSSQVQDTDNSEFGMRSAYLW